MPRNLPHRKQFLRSLRRFTLLTVLVGACMTGTEAMACPNCKFANETEDSRPRAYMYSILFMIGMPATIFTGFGISFYRMSKKAQLAAELEVSGQADTDQTNLT